MSVTTTVERPTTVEKCEVEGIPFECERMPEGKIEFRRLSIKVAKPFKLSRSLRKKARAAMSRQPYTESVNATSEQIVCMMHRSAESKTLSELLSPIAKVIKNSGQSTHHCSHPCGVKQRRRTRPAVTQSNARNAMKVGFSS